MQKLENTKEDRDALHMLLTTGIKPRATIGIGAFTDQMVVVIENYEGVITKIDLESGYCEWENIQGDIMPTININTITLHKSL